MTKGPRRQFEHRRIRSAVIWKKDEKRQCILTILEWVERGGGRSCEVLYPVLVWRDLAAATMEGGCCLVYKCTSRVGVQRCMKSITSLDVFDCRYEKDSLDFNTD